MQLIAHSNLAVSEVVISEVAIIMPENDQTRWIGVRPVNPPENLPVAEQSPLTSIKVEPKEVTTEFKTLTKKRTPAIADLQAIESVVQFYDLHTMLAAGNYVKSTDNVLEGKLWVINYVLQGNSDVNSNIYHSIAEDAVEKVRINMLNGATAWQLIISSGVFIVDEGQHITFTHNGLALGVVVLSTLSGYQVDKY